jgi:hypothetical protein
LTPHRQQRLRAEVTELDQIERAFAPDYDRAAEWNDRPPTRDLLINVARERFPEVFAVDRDTAGREAHAPKEVVAAGQAN